MLLKCRGNFRTSPKYEDAIINLERCKSLITELSNKDSEHAVPDNSYKEALVTHFRKHLAPRRLVELVEK